MLRIWISLLLAVTLCTGCSQEARYKRYVGRSVKAMKKRQEAYRETQKTPEPPPAPISSSPTITIQ